MFENVTLTDTAIDILQEMLHVLHKEKMLQKHVLQNLRIVNPNLLSMNEDALTHLLLYCDNTLTDKTSTFLLTLLLNI